MRTVTYHLVHTGTTFAAGIGQTQIVREGRLIGIKATWLAIGGAGGVFVGNGSMYLNQNTVNDSFTNNPPRETILGSVFCLAAANSIGSSGPDSYIPLNVQVRPGDLITINAGNGGAAAPSNSILSCDFYVQES